MSGTLYVVATPIGNLEDITLRALRVLREVDLIAAEDTRRTAGLLQHYSIPTPTTSLHEHNERQKSASLLEQLKQGKSIAIVSDAGTPVVSDPGSRLVRLARDAGITVVPIPGASAVLAALVASGEDVGQFTFAGFVPAKAGERKKWLKSFAAEQRPVVLFEAPHRLEAFLDDAITVFGDRPITVARELTKAHEQVVTCPISEVCLRLSSGRGEFTIIIPPGTQPMPIAQQLPAASELRSELGVMTSAPGMSTRKAVAELARKYGAAVNDVYRLIQRGGK
jgi:16S rRNA (cytidine1402-2'-O)-methyltransferase